MALWEKLLSSNIFGTVSALFDTTGKVIGLRVNNRDVVDDLGISSDLESKMPKQPTAVNNNVAKFNSDGEVIDSGVSAASLGMIDGESDTYALLPAASGHNGEVWLVKTTTGVIYVNRKVAGFYVSNGTTWTLITPVDVDGYQKLVVSPTANNILKTDANGQSQDAGVAVSTDGTMASNSDAKLPTEKAVRTFLNKTETTVTKYVSDINSSDSNDGNTRFTPYLTVSKAWSDITPSGSVHILGSGTYSVSHTFASSKQSIKTILESGTKITGTIGLVSGNTSMQFFAGKIQATITDASLGTTYFNNVDLSGSMLTFSGGGYKQITNSSSTPTMITLSNLASGTGTLELNNVIGGIVGISVGTGWTVIYRNTIIATIGAVNGIVVEANNTFCNAVLTSQAQLNAISADGYYIINFANPTITGVTVAKGDVIYKSGSTVLCVYKFSFAPTTFAVLNPSNPAQRFTWAKSIDGWIQLGTINTTNLQSTNTVYVDANYGSDANDGLSEYTKVATLETALGIASTGWTVKVAGGEVFLLNSYTLNKTNLTISLEDGAKITGTVNVGSSSNNITFVGGMVSATVNDSSPNVVSFLNCSLSNSVINHTGAGFKYYKNISAPPSNMTTQNGTGTLFFDQVNDRIKITINGGWTTRTRGCVLSIASTSSTSIFNETLNVRQVLASQSELDAVSTDGIYIVNFSSPSISGLSGLEQGDTIERISGIWYIVEKVFGGSSVASVGTTTKNTWIKVNSVWVQPSTSLVSSITGADANTITETGLYIWNSGTNTPFPDGILNVYKRNDLRIVQDFYYAGSSTDQGSQSYNRISFGSSLTWADWNLNVVHAGGLMAANRLLASNGAGTRALSTDITPDNVAQFTTSTSNTLTDYPIGSVILAQDYNAVGPARNSSSTVKYHPTQNYNFVFAGEPGTTLLGTWRARGRNQATNAPVIFQRTA